MKNYSVFFFQKPESSLSETHKIPTYMYIGMNDKENEANIKPIKSKSENFI